MRPPQARPRLLGPGGDSDASPGVRTLRHRRQPAARRRVRGRVVTPTRLSDALHGPCPRSLGAVTASPSGPSLSFPGFSRPPFAHARTPHRSVPPTPPPAAAPGSFSPVPPGPAGSGAGLTVPVWPRLTYSATLASYPVSLGLGPRTWSQLTKGKSQPWKTPIFPRTLPNINIRSSFFI